MFPLELHTKLSVQLWDTENYVHSEYQVVRKKANLLLKICLHILKGLRKKVTSP